ncbi:MAG: hypothetical protein IIA76_06290 [Proteobacteria bacterium]|nr:hypothetical protein [Pseudomonadota bacterium]
MNPRIAAVLFTASLFLAGCFSDADKKDIVGSMAPAPPPGGTAPPPPATGFRAIYVLAAGALPYPNSLFFNGSTDGTMNLPILATSPLNESLNTLDGFSTTQYFNQIFSAPINPATIIGGVTVNVLEVVEDLATTATVGVVGVLIPGVDYSVGLSPDLDAGTTTLQVRPLTPLNPSSSYLVLMTNGITDISGTAATADTDYAGLRDAALAGITLPDPTQDGLRQLIGAHLTIAGAIGMDPASIISSANFRTQSIGNVMAAAAAQTVGQGAVVGPFPGAPVGCPFEPLNTACVLPPSAMPSGNADIYVGQLLVDYYSDTPAIDPVTGLPDTNDVAVIESIWTGAPFTLDPTAAPTNFVHRFNPVPVATTTLGIPLIMTVPNAASAWMQAVGAPPPGGWPVIVFSHGITRNRTDMLALAEPFADAGFVVVAIDHPLHGLTEPNPLVDPTGIFFQAGSERTFDLDVIDNATFAPGPDGLIDISGFHAFLNLGNPLTIRDAWRQGAVDLLALARTIGIIDVDGNGSPNDAADLDGNRVHFVGQSLGSMIGINMLTHQNNDFESATLGVPGGLILQLALDSQSFGALVTGALAAQGLTPGTSLFNNTLRDMQTAIDGADPWNFAAGALGQPVHMIEVIGDATVPNSATERLIDVMGLPGISAAACGGAAPCPNFVSQGVVRFTEGSHGSQLDPTASLAATIEMMTETVVFHAGVPGTLPGGGMVILISDPTVISTQP